MLLLIDCINVLDPSEPSDTQKTSFIDEKRKTLILANYNEIPIFSQIVEESYEETTHEDNNYEDNPDLRRDTFTLRRKGLQRSHKEKSISKLIELVIFIFIYFI